MIPKPWGFETRLEVNEDVALTQLVIRGSRSTSLHCHPTKTTSMVCLSGAGVINFFNSKFELVPGEGFTIRNGLFHQIMNLHQEDDLRLLEFENPSNKYDLIRFSDSHRRENQPYEDEIDVAIDSLNIDKIEKIVKEGGRINDLEVSLNVHEMTPETLHNNESKCNFVVLSGGIHDPISSHLVLRPADFVRRDTLEKLLMRFSIKDSLKVLSLMRRSTSDRRTT